MKKVVKLLIISVLALICASGLVACDGGSSKSEDAGIVCRKFSGDDFYTVVGYNPKEGETSLDISDAAQEKYGENGAKTIVVGRIRTGAFDGNDTLTEVVVKDSATDGVDLTIDEGAFRNMRALKSITLPFIGANGNSDAYYNQTAPAENKATDKERSFGYIFGEDESDNASPMTLSYGDNDGMTAIFYIPVALKEVKVVAENEINIPMYAFCGVKRITTVSFSGKIKAIGDSAFKNMSGLKTINIPASVTVIHENAFAGASMLSALTFDEGSLLTEIKASAFKDCGLTTLDISGTQVNKIGDYAFSGNKSLSTLKFGTSVTNIGAWLLADCDKLTELTYTGDMAGCGEIEGVELGLAGSKIIKIKCSDGDIPWGVA